MPNAPDNWFNDLRGMGFACHALGFPEDLLRNGLIELWLRGAVITRLDDAYSLFDQPAALGSRIWGQTLALLQQPKVAIFAYFNFDWFFHDHGMTAELEAALRCVLEAAVGYWRENPKTFVAALSDHGMRRQEACSFSLLRDPELLALSAHCPGGAGRILYFYARPGAAQGAALKDR
jgi:hypothetical protein